MKTASRSAAILLAVILCLSMLGAAFCISVHSHHHCCGKECAVCAVIAQCEQRLRPVTATAGSIPVLMITVFTVLWMIIPKKREKTDETLVSLKVELLN